MKSSHVLAQDLFRKYLRTGVAIDTGLLLLTAIGRYDREFIQVFKRTHHFTPEDYDLLVVFLAKFKKFFVSPHVLAEFSNFSFEVPARRLDTYLDKVVQLLLPFIEEHPPKDAVLKHQSFKQVGVTDTGLVICCKERDYLLLTTDRKLCGIAGNNGVETIHFDDLRVYWLNAELEL